jgi:hypothetical protein
LEERRKNKYTVTALSTSTGRKSVGKTNTRPLNRAEKTKFKTETSPIKTKTQNRRSIKNIRKGKR